MKMYYLLISVVTAMPFTLVNSAAISAALNIEHLESSAAKFDQRDGFVAEPFFRNAEIAQIFGESNFPSQCSAANQLIHEKKVDAFQSRQTQNIRKKRTPLVETKNFRTNNNLFHEIPDYGLMERRSFEERELLSPQHMVIASIAEFEKNEELDSSAKRFVSSSCLPTTSCDSGARFRTVDGTCNNINTDLTFGSTSQPYQRLVGPHYDNYYDSPRAKTYGGANLPNSRHVSNVVTPVMDKVDPRLTSMVMQWGQFLDHDISLTPTTVGSYASTILDCSHCDSTSTVHPECFPIPIPTGDPIFPASTCFNFVRSASSGSGLVREQLNDVTAYIDASQVYGNNQETADALRTFSLGKLRTSTFSDWGVSLSLLPTDPNVNCRIVSKLCFKSGDSRVNQLPALTSLHTMSMREHNIIAGKLHAINPYWSDERLYQETRRIIGAFFQVITYKEFLPALLGESTMSLYELHLLTTGYSLEYDDHCNAALSNVFAAAAYRLHTLVWGEMMVATKTKSFSVPILKLFLNPELLYHKDHMTGFLKGLQHQQTAAYDRFITDTLHNRLFEAPGKPGLDLMALNIQRGRDHGLPPYILFRNYCKLSPIFTFSSLTEVMDSASIGAIKSVYSSVRDIDAIVGMLAEIPEPGATVGPTASCVLGEQFRRLKYCDRFFHEFNGQPGSFTERQLAELKKITLSRIICDTVDGGATAQGSWEMRQNAMLTASPWLNCKKIMDINFNEWIEQ